MNRNCVFIGGRQIGVNCLKALVERGVFPSVVIPEGDWLPFVDLLRDCPTKKQVFIERKINLPHIIEAIQQVEPEIIFHVGGTRIIPKEILQIPKLGVLNIHPSLLPKNRGRYSGPWAIFKGEEKTGVTIHWMDEGIDTGPIIMQESYPIYSWDTAEDLWETFTNNGTRLFQKFLDLWLNQMELNVIYRMECRSQDNEDATTNPPILPNNGQINWTWDGQQILRFIRAMSFKGYNPVSFNIGNRKFEIREVS